MIDSCVIGSTPENYENIMMSEEASYSFEDNGTSFIDPKRSQLDSLITDS